jgi:glycosyltransferase involved in cell wall biosynthesis
MKQVSSVLIFYPFFPTYRQGILQALARRPELGFFFAAGTRGRAGIKSLTKAEFSDLRELRAFRFRGVSIHLGILRESLSSKHDVVVVAPATLSITVWGILFLRRLFRRQTFLWGQCGKPGDIGLKRAVQEVTNRLATGLLVYGESERAGAIAWGTNPRKVFVVNNAVEHPGVVAIQSRSEFDSASFARGVGNPTSVTDVVVTYVGRVSHQKRVGALIDAVKLLSNDFPRLRAIIVGDGAALQEIRERVHRENLPVEILGAIHDSDELSQILTSTTLVVAPSEIGLLAIDAVQHGIPVLYGDNPLNNGPEVEALTLGVNAATFAPGDPNAIAAAIVDWMARAPSIDPAHYRDATISAIEIWSPENVAANIASALQGKRATRNSSIRRNWPPR